MIVADQTAIGFAAELSVFLLVDLLEDRALVPGGALELLQGASELALRDVHHPDLQHLVGFGVVDEVLEAAPGGFQPLEVLIVQDHVDLLRELAVDLRDDRLDRANRIVGDQSRMRQRLFGEGPYRPLDGIARTIRLRLELLVQQGGEVAGFDGDRLLRRLGFRRLGFGSGHLYSSAEPGVAAAGAGADASACSRAGSLSARVSRSSAPVLPSM